MKTITHNLSSELDHLNLYLFADEHIGDMQSMPKRIQERIEKCKSDPNGYCILNGDIIDYASRSSIGDIETRSLNIMEQLDRAVEMFTPIKDKILCITSGNHEARSYKKEGIDIARLMSVQLGLSCLYTPGTAIVFVALGKASSAERHDKGKMVYSIMVNHGRGAGRKEGSKAQILADMASIADTDCYVMSHTHLPLVMKESFFRVNLNKKNVKQVMKLFVNTGSNLDYGGYGEGQMFKPTSTDMPLIIFDGSVRNMKCVL